ncbi:MAG TPA: transporter substrate-binding domain-containing protein [Clostridiaceae bacterium]|nr:transporter substrate-binding domain-containing protein [Clostridiaceae bacterium]
MVFKSNINSKKTVKLLALILTAAISLFAVSACKTNDEQTLTAVGSGGYRPFNYINDTGEVIGFDVDVAEEVATRLGMELDYVTAEWSGLVEGLRNEQFDAIIGSMAITEERQKTVSFTRPYYYSGAQLVVRKDSGITSPSEMEGLQIGVATGSNFAMDAENLQANVQYYDDDNATAMDLIAGRVDGVITDKIVALEIVSKIEGGDQLQLCGDLLRTEQMGIAININNEELLEEVDKIIEEMHRDGTLSEISQKWLDGEDITKE